MSRTPTEPRDYALVTASYAALAGGVAAVAARHRHEDPAPLDPAELAVYGLATAGLSRVLGHEKVASWVRAPFVEEPEEGVRRPRGRGLRYTVGELLSCTRCLGSWSALALIGARAVAPREARVGATLLALSYLNDLLQALAAGQQAVARREEREAEAVTSERNGHGTWRTDTHAKSQTAE